MKRQKLQIKFNRNYYKFADKKLPFTAVLLQCFKVHYKDLSACFKAYDVTSDEGDYPLPKTDLIVLLLMFDDKKLFTTIRRYTPRKWDYYKTREGETFELVSSRPA